jgi:hypothetical protein
MKTIISSTSNILEKTVGKKLEKNKQLTETEEFDALLYKTISSHYTELVVKINELIDKLSRI